MRDPMFDILFEPVKIGPVTAPNRFYSVPHATGHGFEAPMGAIGLREMKARGGWGVVSTQMTEIGPESDMANHRMERLWDDSDLPAHRLFVERIKKHGALTAIEIAHGGMRARNMTSGLPTKGPSNLPVFRPEVPVQTAAMSKTDITELRASHRRAALRAKQAGYDIIYVYAGHGLTIFNHFLSRNANQRSDEYGGSFENRARLLREVIEDTKEAVGDTCAVALRFSVEEFGPSNPITHDGEGRELVEMLAEYPDLWDVNLSSWPADSATARFSEEGFQEDYISFVKTVTNKPVVGVGRYTSPSHMVSLVKKNVLDFIGAARPSIADPFLPNKIAEGRIEDIRECIGCNICVSSDDYGVPLRCTQNPTIAEEWRRDWHPEIVPASKSKKNILIVGAGPAGLECGLTLAKAGHQVTITEARAELGGRALLESRLHGLASWKRIVDYRTYQLQQRANVDIFTNSEMTADDIVDFGADHVVLATGATWRRDGVGSTRFAPFNSMDKENITTPDDIFAGNIPCSGEHPILIYDDDHFYMGGVLADHLAKRGSKVVYATPHSEVSAWTGHTLEQSRIIRTLSEKGVELNVNTTLREMGEGVANLTCTLTGKESSRHFSSFVMVGARLQNSELTTALQDKIAPQALWTIGDCLAPGIIQAAVYSGHRTARLIDNDPLAGGSFKREHIGISSFE